MRSVYEGASRCQSVDARRLLDIVAAWCLHYGRAEQLVGLVDCRRLFPYRIS
jgi:hypothetical protein